MSTSTATQRNVLGGDLLACCFNPVTGYFRDGYCRVVPSDTGNHSVCARVRVNWVNGFVDA